MTMFTCYMRIKYKLYVFTAYTYTLYMISQAVVFLTPIIIVSYYARQFRPIIYHYPAAFKAQD